MKLLKLFPMIIWTLLGKQVRTDYKSKYKDKDKPKLLRRRYLGTAVTLIGGILSTKAVLASGASITPELMMLHVQKLSDAGIEIYNVLSGIKESLIFLWGIVLLVGGIIFKRT